MQQKIVYHHPKVNLPVSDQNYQKRIDHSGRHNRHSHKRRTRSAKNEEPQHHLRGGNRHGDVNG